MILDLRTTTALLIAATVLDACDTQGPKPAREAVGQYTSLLSFHVGGIWGGGFSVNVAPEEYAVVEHSNCRTAKERALDAEEPKGLCVVRISKEQSDRFEAAMERFKRNAVPLQSYSVEDPFVRPDGKPCRNRVTDSTIMTLMWSGTEGVRIANFYTGCDPEEFDNFYRSVLAITDTLPIDQIIGKMSTAPHVPR